MNFPRFSKTLELLMVKKLERWGESAVIWRNTLVVKNFNNLRLGFFVIGKRSWKKNFWIEEMNWAAFKSIFTKGASCYTSGLISSQDDGGWVHSLDCVCSVFSHVSTTKRYHYYIKYLSINGGPFWSFPQFPFKNISCLLFIFPSFATMRREKLQISRFKIWYRLENSLHLIFYFKAHLIPVLKSIFRGSASCITSVRHKDTNALWGHGCVMKMEKKKEGIAYSTTRGYHAKSDLEYYLRPGDSNVCRPSYYLRLNKKAHCSDTGSRHFLLPYRFMKCTNSFFFSLLLSHYIVRSLGSGEKFEPLFFIQWKFAFVSEY